jgi:DHA1 family inner membrane transport protein
VTANNRIAVAGTLAFWGFFAFMIAPAVQTAVMRVAEPYGADLVKVAGGLNVSAFNVGIAVASFAGGQVVGSFDAIDTPWIGIVLALGGFAVMGVIRGTGTTFPWRSLPETR